jgi:hypothetical protein
LIAAGDADDDNIESDGALECGFRDGFLVFLPVGFLVVAAEGVEEGSRWGDNDGIFVGV